jgi:hypothetical protein
MKKWGAIYTTTPRQLLGVFLRRSALRAHPFDCLHLTNRFGSRGCCGFLGIVLLAAVFTINLSIEGTAHRISRRLTCRAVIASRTAAEATYEIRSS